MTRSAEIPRTAERRAAWTAAKLAVRRYAREPSANNEVKVQNAWLRVRHVMSGSPDRSTSGSAKRGHH